MSGPFQALLDGGARLHLQHGPIDLIIGAEPLSGGDRGRAFRAAAARFSTVLDELVAELPLLSTEISAASPTPEGAVARRMDRAVRRFSPAFATAMAAVAGAVADEVLAAMLAVGPLARAYVNNGGDIALHLTPGASFSLAIAGLDGADLGRISVKASDGIGGIATSGQGGRSLSFGIADSVTVLARDAATADTAATLIGNAVDLPGHPAIRRRPAAEMRSDSDLGDRLVVAHVGPLSAGEIGVALHAGADLAECYLKSGLIAGAALSLRGSARIIGGLAETTPIRMERMEHA